MLTVMQYALSDGRGLQESRLLEFFEEHARTMLAHMITLPDMRKRKLYMFLRNTYTVSKICSSNLHQLTHFQGYLRSGRR